MKKILITGANSYIGTSLEDYLKSFGDEFIIDTIDMKNESWKDKSFIGYDTIFHVAGIAHSDSGKISEDRKKLYYKVNTDLVIDTAKKAKDDKVKQFIFMSSIIVYGESSPIGIKKIIKTETMFNPSNCYSDSKLQAEKGLYSLEGDEFKIAIIRPPMIYGKDSKGNYPILSKVSRKLPIFPYIENEKSMLYIGNLLELLRLIIVNNDSGIFYPQNKEYVNTSLLVKEIAKCHNRKIFLIRGFGWLFKILGKYLGLVNKIFGNFVYDQKISEYKEEYRIYSFEKSIELTEGKEI